MADLLSAIGTLSTKLIPNSTGDKRRAYIVRMADYSHRLLFAEVPQLAIEKVADEATVSDLSTDPRVALAQILAHLDFDPAAASNDKVAVLAKASPDDNRNLALLGFFGQPDNGPAGVDWSLFKKYYKQTPVGLTSGGQPTEGNWVPATEAIAQDGPWQTYSRGE